MRSVVDRNVVMRHITVIRFLLSAVSRLDKNVDKIPCMEMFTANQHAQEADTFP